MSRIQKLMMKLLPAAWAEDMRRDSQNWLARCKCGHTRSIWELGGIRWKAYGNSRNLIYCPACGKYRWHILERRHEKGIE